MTKGNFKNMNQIEFDEFKQSQVKPLSAYKNSTIIKELFGNDEQRISEAYEQYCLCKFNRYLVSFKGGNPANMI